MDKLAKITMENGIKPKCTIEFEDLTDPKQLLILAEILELLEAEGYGAEKREPAESLEVRRWKF
jgi:hypothetical protein